MVFVQQKFVDKEHFDNKSTVCVTSIRYEYYLTPIVNETKFPI